MKRYAPHRLVGALAIFLLSLAVQAAQSPAEKAGFVVTAAMREAMNSPGRETPKAWLGNAIQFNYQTDLESVEVGRKYRLPEARKACAAGDADACATAGDIERWLNWAKDNALPVVPACDRAPCDHLPDQLVPAALKGKFWVLHAWGSWCPYCGLDHSRFVDSGAGRKLRLVSLVFQDSEAAAARFLAERGNPYTGGNLGLSPTVLSSLHLRNVPATYVINPDGNVQERFQGTLDDTGQKALEKYFR